MKTKACIIAILLAAGLINSRAQDTWTQKADFGGGTRGYAVGFTIGSKGYLGTGNNFADHDDFWEYDPIANVWTQKANFGGGLTSSGAGFSTGNKGYLLGGGHNDFWEFDPIANTWTQKTNFPGIARVWAVGFSIGSKGYIGTGTGNDSNLKKDLWEYDSSTNAWTQKADFGGTARTNAAGFSIASKGYIGTGTDINGSHKDFYEYDPSTNIWTQKADFGGEARQYATGLSIDTKGYIGTGNGSGGSGSFLRDFWQYDPTTNTWTRRANFGGTGRYYATGFSIGSKGYIGTGYTSSSFVADFWEYTPATAQTNPVPLISQPLVPDAIAPGGAGFTLTVNGAGFVSGASINWNGASRVTAFVSTSQVTAAILASDIATASTASVTVDNPSPAGGRSNAVFFPITTSAVPSFNRTDIPAGSSPQYPATADLNGDGKLDLAVANFSSNAVSVLLGIGDGTFQNPVAYSTGAEPLGVTIRDLNQDSIPDLIVANFGDATVSILLGNGDGTFQNQTNFPAGEAPVYVISADFNVDGKLDLAVADQNCTNGCGPGTVSILLGNGDGTFEGATRAASSPGANFVTTGDFNGDAKLDLAVAAGNGSGGTTVSVLLGNGDGTFQDPVDYTTALNPAAVETADFNGDGKLDLAVVNFFGPTVSILLGNGDGTFQPQVGYMTGLSPNRNFSIADLNGDGTLDLAISNTASNTVSTLSGNGDGTFGEQVQFATGSNPNGVGSGDFNGDGRLDLAVANFNDNTVSILLQATTSYRDVILADNPIMYWRLGETSGTIAYDETANHRDATYINQPFLGLPGAIANDTNTSVGFNGFNQWVRWIPTSSYFGAFTVEAWVKEKQIRPVETFFNTRTKTAEFSFDFKLDVLAGKEIHFDVGDGTKWLSTSSVPFDFKRNVWYYVAAVVTRRGATYYVDGSAIGSVTYRGIPLLFDATHKVEIGTNTRYDSEWFDGAIDEVAVYNYALTADQIAAHYATGTGN